MKKVIVCIIAVVLALTSIGIVSYPMVSSYLNSLNSSSEVVHYLDSAATMPDDGRAEILAAAREYNESLLAGVGMGDPFGEPQNTSGDYDTLLSIDGNPVMATVEIPCIGLNLPIYHGTGDDVLQHGVGHLSCTSLPVGGIGTHAVLTGHSGLSSNKLFSDIVSLQAGDVILIHVLGETLAYQVDQILTVLPTETEALEIDPAQDYVTLVTCTPFGVNTHRLLVRGTRIPYTETEVEQVRLTEQTTDGGWQTEYIRALELGVAVMLGILAVFGVAKLIGKKAKRER